jgi:PAS domain S-box-containing protein
MEKLDFPSEIIYALKKSIKFVPGVVYFADKNYVIRFIEGKSLSSLGLEPKELINTSLYDLYDSVKIDEIVDVINKHGEYRNIIPFNKFHFDLWIVGIKDSNESLLGYVGVAREVNEFINTKSSLIESEEKFKLIVENAPVGILFAEKDGSIKDVNIMLLKVLGSPSAEMTKQINLLTFPPLVDIGFSKDFIKCLETKEIIENEVLYTSKWGKNSYLRYQLVCVQDINSNVIGLQVIFEDITPRKKAEEKIRESLKEKEILLKEIHHRVKNNLQIISSLLSLQEGHIKDKSKATNEVFKDSQNRLRSMALIHEELYKAKDFSKINFEQYVQNLTNYLYQSYRIHSTSIEIDVEAHEILLDIETAIPLGLIINELVSNSLKYAFNSKYLKENICKISVKMEQQEDNNYELIISDTGVGISDKIDFRQTESLGMQLIVSLTEQLDGTIELNKEEGTKFIIKFRELKYKKS